MHETDEPSEAQPTQDEPEQAGAGWGEPAGPAASPSAGDVSRPRPPAPPPEGSRSYPPPGPYPPSGPYPPEGSRYPPPGPGPYPASAPGPYPPAAAPPPGGWGGYGHLPPAGSPSAGVPPGGWGGEPGRRDSFWEPQPPRRGSVSVAITAILVLVAVLVGVGIGRSLPTSPSSSQTGTSPSGSSGPSGSPSTTPSRHSPSSSQVSKVAARIDRSLVDIDTNLAYEDEEAAGTGIILTSGGLVLTNNHVIDGETTLRVTDVDTGRQYPGTVLGYDEKADVALVRMDGASGLDPATIAKSTPAVGEKVVAVGNAGGKGGTPAAAGGTVTAVDQSITATDEGNGTTERLTGLIRTDAEVQPGDSGGSLVNTEAEVIGMDTAASLTFSITSSGDEGFAIPIGAALHVADQIVAGHASATVHIGATAFIGVEVAPKMCTQGPGPRITEGTGALVCEVIGSAASKAGLVADDVITSLAGDAVTSPSALTHLLVAYRPGETTTLGYTSSSGQKHTTSITFGSGPPG